MTDPGAIVRAHLVRSYHGPPRYRDGLPEIGTPEYEALSPEQQLEVGEMRVGVFRDRGEDNDVPPPLRSPRRYGAEENNPIDREDWL